MYKLISAHASLTTTAAVAVAIADANVSSSKSTDPSPPTTFRVTLHFLPRYCAQIEYIKNKYTCARRRRRRREEMLQDRLRMCVQARVRDHQWNPSVAAPALPGSSVSVAARETCKECSRSLGRLRKFPYCTYKEIEECIIIILRCTGRSLLCTNSSGHLTDPYCHRGSY